MNSIVKEPERDAVDHNLTGFGVEELSRREWLQVMRRALKDVGVPEQTRRTLEPALDHFADEVKPEKAA